MDARIRNLMGNMPKLKQASSLWLEGFREACCLHRVIIYCLRSKELAIRTGQCFLLNGFIFLGSILVLRSVAIPTIGWLLPDGYPHVYLEEPCWGIFRFYSYLRFGLIQLFYVFWFYPMYIFSFILSTIWYNDIAKYGFFAIEKYQTSDSRSSGQKDTRDSLTKTNSDTATDIEGLMIGIAEQIYSILLLSFFFLQVYVTGFVPYIGKALSFLLLSWMYAYYCFEYKWNYSGLSLNKRLDFFESNWPFFAGFGSPCVLAVFFYSPLVSYGVMATLYPLNGLLRWPSYETGEFMRTRKSLRLWRINDWKFVNSQLYSALSAVFLISLFVLTATGSEADKVIASQRKKWKGAGLGRVPIFVSANYLSLKVLSLFPIKHRPQEVHYQ